MVDWDCLLETLRLRGFRNKWITWIEMWLTTAKTQVMINGVVGKEIPLKRGLRLGDPLSSLLFVLIGDSLNNMLGKMVRVDLIYGLSGCTNSFAHKSSIRR